MTTNDPTVAGDAPITALDLLGLLPLSSYPSSSALLAAIGELFDQNPKRVPFGFTPTDLLFWGREHDFVLFSREGVRIQTSA